MKFYFFSGALFLLMVLAQTKVNPERKLPATECTVTFSIYNAGIEVTGTLEAVTVEIHFDPADLGRSTMAASAEPSTINTGILVRDKHLKRTDFFDTGKYPEIHLRSKAFRKTDKNKFSGQFDLTIKNVTKSIVIPFTRSREGHTVLYRGGFEIDRLDFNLGERSVILDEKVKVFLKAKTR